MWSEPPFRPTVQDMMADSTTHHSTSFPLYLGRQCLLPCYILPFFQVVKHEWLQTIRCGFRLNTIYNDHFFISPRYRPNCFFLSTTFLFSLYFFSLLYSAIFNFTFFKVIETFSRRIFTKRPTFRCVLFYNNRCFTCLK
jgi:hypothetical protein